MNLTFIGHPIKTVKKRKVREGSVKHFVKHFIAFEKARVREGSVKQIVKVLMKLQVKLDFRGPGLKSIKLLGKHDSRQDVITFMWFSCAPYQLQ